MDSRSTFLHHLESIDPRGDAEGQAYGVSDVPGRDRRGISQANPGGHNPEESGEVRLRPNQLANSTLPRKTSRGAIRVTVPQTGTGRRGENPKARERTLAKELGKIAP